MSRNMARLTDFARRQRHLWRFRVLNPLRYAADNALMAFEATTAGDASACRMLLVSDTKVVTSEEQLTPFRSYRADLRRHIKVVSLHLLLDDVLRLPKAAIRSFDMVGLKMSFRLSVTEVSDIGRRIVNLVGKRPLIYLDGDDDLCIMHPEILSWVDVYVKKHAFKDRAQYLRRFIGKSNLTDFVHRKYQRSFAEDPHMTECPAVDSAVLSKIFVGWNVALDSNIASLFAAVAATLTPVQKNVDIMFRGNVPKDWLYYLRKDIEPALRKMQSAYNVIIPQERVTRSEYYREMRDSKICVSPFGYGEICWRDLEAIMCGCLLVKPDMSHVDTVPNIFKSNETYVPVLWDYSDLEEKCAYYLAHDDERRKIAAAAFEVLADYYGRKEFLNTVSGILGRIPRPRRNG